MSRLLLVDDEINILNALRRELSDKYDIETFTSPYVALGRCREIAFDMVIADYKMPDMNGAEFLKQFSSIQPDAARMLLSGEADIDGLVRLINETHIYLFVAKPWDRSELESSINQALAYRDIMLENRRLADTHPRNIASEQQASARPYHIVLVDGDEYSLGIMLRGLADEDGNASVFSAMQKEIMPGVSADFRGCKFIVNGFTTAEAALGHAGQNGCDLVIAAQTLQDMNGIQLLSKFREILPDAARILVTGSPNKSVLTQAINEVHVHSALCLYWKTYGAEPDDFQQAWNILKLRTAAIQALTSQDLLLENRRLLDATEDRPNPDLFVD